MTTQYSLKEFHINVRELAKQAGKEYVHIGVELDNYGNIEFKCYVEGYDYERGKTPQEVLEKVRNKMFPVPVIEQNNDVIVEVVAQEQLS